MEINSCEQRLFLYPEMKYDTLKRGTNIPLNNSFDTMYQEAFHFILFRIVQ